MSQNGLLKMSELAERSGVSAGTIKHYLREGLLGDGDEVVRTSRNMAWYPPAFVERVRLIKRLQEERFMPLKVIRTIIAEEAIRERALAAGETERLSAAEVRRALRGSRRTSWIAWPSSRSSRRPRAATTPTTCRSSRRSRAFARAATTSAWASPSSTRCATATRSTRSSQEEVRTLLDRLAGEVDVDRAVEIIASGAAPLRELIGAMHSKLLRAELRRQGRT